jgi:hypothetical protein
MSVGPNGSTWTCRACTCRSAAIDPAVPHPGGHPALQPSRSGPGCVRSGPCSRRPHPGRHGRGPGPGPGSEKNPARAGPRWRGRLDHPDRGRRLSRLTPIPGLISSSWLPVSNWPSTCAAVSLLRFHNGCREATGDDVLSNVIEQTVGSEGLRAQQFQSLPRGDAVDLESQSLRQPHLTSA